MLAFILGFCMGIVSAWVSQYPYPQAYQPQPSREFTPPVREFLLEPLQEPSSFGIPLTDGVNSCLKQHPYISKLKHHLAIINPMWYEDTIDIWFVGVYSTLPHVILVDSMGNQFIPSVREIPQESNINGVKPCIIVNMVNQWGEVLNYEGILPFAIALALATIATEFPSQRESQQETLYDEYPDELRRKILKYIDKAIELKFTDEFHATSAQIVADQIKHITYPRVPVTSGTE